MPVVFLQVSVLISVRVKNESMSYIMLLFGASVTLKARVLLPHRDMARETVASIQSLLALICVLKTETITPVVKIPDVFLLAC